MQMVLRLLLWKRAALDQQLVGRVRGVIDWSHRSRLASSNSIESEYYTCLMLVRNPMCRSNVAVWVVLWKQHNSAFDLAVM